MAAGAKNEGGGYKMPILGQSRANVHTQEVHTLLSRHYFSGDLEASGKTYRIKSKLKYMFGNQLVYAYLNENECDEISPIVSIETLNDHKRAEKIFKEPLESTSTQKISRIEESVQAKRKTSKAHTAAAEAAIKRNSASEAESSCTVISDSEFFTELSEWKVDTSGVEDNKTGNVYCGNNSNSSVVLRPGEYDIVLIVDAMEVTGGYCGGKKSRKALTIEQLQALQVPFETRKLSIGDFIWVARDKRFWDRLQDDYTSEQGGGKKLTAKKNRELKEAAMARELVLPYIVERKRTDDLRSSIMDGRYKEQKQRLSQCGVLNKFYLVEEIGGRFVVDMQGNHRGIDRDVIEQAISNTAVRDGFYIKRTKTQGESMKYLATFTSALVQKYTTSRITLKSCPIQNIAWNQSDSLANTFSVSNSVEFLPNFVEFNELSRPDKPLSVREIFCNMLVSVKGLSPGMAWAISERYPTPHLLRSAYEDIANENLKEREKEVEKVLAGIPYDYPLSKKVPPGIAKIVGHLFSDASLN